MPLIPLWAKIAAPIVALAVAYGAGHHFGTQSERTEWEAKVSEARAERIVAYEAKITAAKAAQAKAEADSAALSTTLANEQANVESLQTALSRAKLVTHVVEVPGQPPVARLSRAFRLCITAGTTGNASDLASCEAVRMPVPTTP
jgi:hypothetical protein